MDIFELAMAKKLFGGGGGKREGTAIPVGQHVDRIYFNTELSVEEMRNYLSQLTYVQTALLDYPIYPIFVYTQDGLSGYFIIAVRVNDKEYMIQCITGIPSQDFATIYASIYGDSDESYKGWIKSTGVFALQHSPVNFDLTIGSLGVDGASIADFNGLPIGAENEKIKNVLSATPF